MGCTSLTSLTLTNSLTCIGEYAFSGCSSLTSLLIPESVHNIEVGAFSGCTALSSLTLPKSLSLEASFADRPKACQVAWL